jgi:hypothetical protein
MGTEHRLKQLEFVRYGSLVSEHHRDSGRQLPLTCNLTMQSCWYREGSAHPLSECTTENVEGVIGITGGYSSNTSLERFSHPLYFALLLDLGRWGTCSCFFCLQVRVRWDIIGTYDLVAIHLTNLPGTDRWLFVDKQYRK